MTTSAAFGSGRNYRKYEFATGKYLRCTFQLVFTSSKLVAFHGTTICTTSRPDFCLSTTTWRQRANFFHFVPLNSHLLIKID